MLQTKGLNAYLGTAYTLEEVAALDAVVFDVAEALAQGLSPRKDKA